MLVYCLQLITEKNYILQVTPNLYGNLVANVAAGIAGGTGFMPGGKPHK